jgi:hypothetical protein
LNDSSCREDQIIASGRHANKEYKVKVFKKQQQQKGTNKHQVS